jgi:hypothetical protein
MLPFVEGHDQIAILAQGGQERHINKVMQRLGVSACFMPTTQHIGS